MPIVKSNIAFHKAEVFGRENSGKSVYAYSICQLLDLKSKKINIEVFTNESSWAETLKLFPDYKKYFTIRQHRDLNEFRGDWIEFCKKYKLDVITDKHTGQKHWTTKGVEDQVFAVIIDEGFYILESLISKHYEENIKTDGVDKRMRQTDYGVPRQEFIKEIKKIFMLPCHVIITSKVKDEFEEISVWSETKQRDYKQWIRTGGDIYALPPMWVYEPANRIHLRMYETPLWEMIDDPKDRLKKRKIQKPIVDSKTGIQKMDRKFLGIVEKQKADRSKDLVIEKPTVKKVELQLKLLAMKAAEKI